MVNVAGIQPHMQVMDSNDQPFAVVDHLDDGQTLKLTKDNEGQHHWIPIGWVTRVDQFVHIDRPATEARQQWLASIPPVP